LPITSSLWNHDIDRVIVKRLVRVVDAGGNRAMDEDLDDDDNDDDDDLLIDTWYFLIAFRRGW
jgi:hypothetical protein